MIHGSSEGRFHITYATEHLSQAEIEGVNFNYRPYKEAIQRYPVAQLENGYHTLPSGEEIYYISNPALGLWALKEKFQ